MGMDHNSCSHSDFNRCGGFKRITNAIVLKYCSEGETKSGIVRIHLAFNHDNDDLEYKGVEYSDDDLRRYLETNPSILTKIYFNQFNIELKVNEFN
jgi:hypothetical protein